MKLKVLKLRNATVLDNSQMKAVWGRNGYGDPYDGYDEPIDGGGYLPEFTITCGRPTIEGGTGICWKPCEDDPTLCIATGDPNDVC